MYGASESGVAFDASLPRYIRITDIKPDGTLDPEKAVSLPRDTAQPYLLTDRDILLARSGATVGKAFLYRSNGEDACFAGYLIRARCDQRRIIPEYLSYYLQSAGYWDFINSSALQATIQNVSAELYKEISVTHPTVEQQKNVVAYLDEQTAKIDRLMDMRRRQMALLKEQRAAMIQQAVTRGLDPNVPMKDSGLPWLGVVPVHWRLTRAKFVSEIFVPQRNKPDLNEGEGYYWVTMEEMNRPVIDSATYRVSDAALTIAGSRILPSGAVIASCVGNFGAASISAVPVVINQQLQAFIPCKINAEFLRLIITVSASYFEMIATAATLVYVNQDGFANLPIPLPPVEEQLEIINFIATENSKFDTLHTSYARQLTLLTEYRAALIHECVTGVRSVLEVNNV
jgi:type I restriction enzyme S subunit